MELLVFVRQYYNGDSAKMGHWLDTEYLAQIAKIEARIDLTYEQTLKAKNNKEDAYNARPRLGDITEVHEDGWWDAKCLGPKSLMPVSYACVKIPGVKPIKYLADRALLLRSRNMVTGVHEAGEILTRSADNPGIYDKVSDKLFVVPKVALSG